MLPGCDQINAVSHAERLRLAFNRIAVNTPSGPRHFTASFGVTVVRPETRVDAQTAIRTADSAMYAAKHAGRDRVEFSAVGAGAGMMASSMVNSWKCARRSGARCDNGRE